MLITDGAPETYEQLFEEYNWPDKQVCFYSDYLYPRFMLYVLQIRVFTYLIGREVGDSRQVEWMACSNKGVIHANYQPVLT